MPGNDQVATTLRTIDGEYLTHTVTLELGSQAAFSLVDVPESSGAEIPILTSVDPQAELSTWRRVWPQAGGGDHVEAGQYHVLTVRFDAAVRYRHRVVKQTVLGTEVVVDHTHTEDSDPQCSLRVYAVLH